MRKCIICGARVTNINPRSNTCDPVCTRAKHNEVDRPTQIRLDLAYDYRKSKREIREEQQQ